MCIYIYIYTYISIYIYIYTYISIYYTHVISSGMGVKPRVWRLAIFKELDLNDPFLVANISV